MMRGGGNRQMRRMIDKMGLDMQELPNIREVLIRTDRKEIIVSNPSVTQMKAKDQTVFMVTSDGYEEAELEVPVFSDDDIELVCTQAGVDRERAVAALTETKGDLAQAILHLTAG